MSILYSFYSFFFLTTTYKSFPCLSAQDKIDLSITWVTRHIMSIWSRSDSDDCTRSSMISYWCSSWHYRTYKPCDNYSAIISSTSWKSRPREICSPKWFTTTCLESCHSRWCRYINCLYRTCEHTIVSFFSISYRIIVQYNINKSYCNNS